MLQVMKMYMPLVAQEDGVPLFVKQAGVSLEPGDIIGILTLDDPSRIKHAKPFEGQLPDMGHPSIIGSKPHQRLAWDVDILNSILDGFDNQAIMSAILKDLFEVLRNHELPFVEATAVLATLSGRMPSKLEESVRHSIDAAKAKSSHEFPAARIKKILDTYLNELRPQDRTMARSSIQTLIDLAERYKYGLRAHEWNTVAALFARYIDTEKLFGGDIEQRVHKLREENKDDLEKVVQIVLSHIKAPSKNKLVLSLLDTVKDYGAAALRPEINLAGVLKDLAALESRSANPVSLKAREVLILCHMPSYDERTVSMEAVLRASVTPATYGESTVRRYLSPHLCQLRNIDVIWDSDPNFEVLKELTDSRWIVFDVLPTFFCHDDPGIALGMYSLLLNSLAIVDAPLAALEVYVRRAYRAYTLLSIDHEEGDGLEDGDAPHIVTWRFKLGQSNSPPSTPRLDEHE